MFRTRARSLLVGFFLFAVFSLLCFAISPNAHGDQVSLALIPSTDANPAGYRIYYGNASGSYASVIDIGNTTSCTISNLQDGNTYYFVATDYDAHGNESGYSNEVIHSIATPCTYSISPASQTYDSSGGSGTLNITTQAGCAWTAGSNSSWLIITSNPLGTGNGTLNYALSANSNTVSRSGTITIAGNTFRVSEAGTPGYSLTVNKAGTGTGTVAVNPAGTTFAEGTVLTLVAKTNPNSTFTGWSGGCSGISSSCTILMSSNTSVTATFTRKGGKKSF